MLMALSKRKIDEYYMHGALSLALRGTGKVSPNPLVGCVVVKDGSVISRGWHRRFGLPHAEAMALEGGEDLRGSTLYVNLEPCSHRGKTPPCAPLIAERGVTRVVAGMVDPDPRVQGRGLNFLREKGIEVETGVLETECRWINRGFIRKNTLGRPWVTVKGALSLDGGMALESGESKWITGSSARSMAHLLRAESDAILVGAGTAARDDPELTVRST
ncbi:MAG: bifunctional diaminohydroxyphosphoribosylaminopyrimidine deaminase/5-amino-6-(5-phosphoribosylamino)uracil reductase RibD, partial [Synergistaceae bacterium]|nr:bifunctional diaminohydroxyphosphoribosylaminopyrimidine deaminase/5-amino-6-(5-phosphoribosylamino)uracil reductase RibD [Synergistaceae bacterium]